MQHTISIFKHFAKNISPVIPVETAEKVKMVLTDLENNRYQNLAEAEFLIINLGYELWPWNKSFQEYFKVYEDKVGEEFLLSKLSAELKEKFYNYKIYGLGWREIYLGKFSSYFTPDERLEMIPAFLTMKKDLRHYLAQEILGLEKEKYLLRVKHHQSWLDRIKNHFRSLRDLAKRNEDSEHLSKGIEARVKSFEYGLCFLGPELKYDEVVKAVDYFYGREKELNRMHGIHTPLKVNFY